MPEYYLTRTEAALLESLAPGLMLELAPVDIVELGAGSSSKTRRLLDARNGLREPIRYVPIDVAELTVAAAATQLIADYPFLTFTPSSGISSGTWETCRHAGPGSCFFGSPIGNLDPPARQRCSPMCARCSRTPEDRFPLASTWEGRCPA